MERLLLGISLLEHNRSEVIREQSGVKDAIAVYQKQKFYRNGHVATGVSVQLSSGIRKEHSEDLYDDRNMKLSNDLNQNREEGRDPNKMKVM